MEEKQYCYSALFHGYLFGGAYLSYPIIIAFHVIVIYMVAVTGTGVKEAIVGLLLYDAWFAWGNIPTLKTPTQVTVGNSGEIELAEMLGRRRVLHVKDIIKLQKNEGITIYAGFLGARKSTRVIYMKESEGKKHKDWFVIYKQMKDYDELINLLSSK